MSMATRLERRPEEMSALMASGSELAPLSLMSGSPIRMPSHMRDKYEEACLERRKDFTPLCYSVDGMPCEAARSAERRLASLLAHTHTH
eukprot:CCRYP_019815-RA/>CCRYP_019815-RA protein AED:0.48 eAED:0.48 QI:0/0/0/0.66/1/1/3/0/88